MTNRYCYLACIPFFLLYIVIAGCGDQTDHQKNFLANYHDYCGNAYSGETILADLSSGDQFLDVELTMILSHCEDEEVRIPFHVGDDTSRTWILKRTPQGLHLSHDHRYEDGTQHDHNLYGGYADNEGSDLLQYFPADHRTIEDRPVRQANRWAKEFDKENGNYHYRLYLNDELRFEAIFDLNNPLEI